ncbi:unnamed protein product [Alopecurus aequalis]
MSPLHVQAHLLLLLLLASSISSRATILEDACKYVAGDNKDIVSYDYCIKFFQGDKGSATADKFSLAIIAANITRVAAKNISKRIATLQASVKGILIQRCLDYCASEYSQTADDLGIAMHDTALGPAQDLWTAKSKLIAAADSPDKCEAVFGDVNQTSLLSAENSEFVKKAVIALLVNPS